MIQQGCLAPYNTLIFSLNSHVFRRNFTTIDYIHCTESHLCPQKAKRKLAAIGPQYFLSDNIDTQWAGKMKLDHLFLQ
jgi:hypothetical protein